MQELGLKIVLLAHLGRPKGERNLEFSLEPVGKRLSVRCIARQTLP